MLRVLIVDDEVPARRRVRRLLQAETDLEVIGECADGEAAIATIVGRRPELVLLDVQMPERDGFAVVRGVPAAARPAVIFMTAFDRYALEAFEIHAIDYLLKPFTPERFRVAIGRARDRIQRRAADAALERLVRDLPERPAYASRLAVRSRGRVVLVPVERIDWIAAADNYVVLHAGGHEHLLREPLAALERRLDPAQFVRIHRSTVVRLDRIHELLPASHGDVDVRLRDGTSLTLSRTWRARLARILGRAL